MKTYTVTFDDEQYAEVQKVLEFIQTADDGIGLEVDHIVIDGALDEMEDAHVNDSGD